MKRRQKGYLQVNVMLSSFLYVAAMVALNLVLSIHTPSYHTVATKRMLCYFKISFTLSLHLYLLTTALHDQVSLSYRIKLLFDEVN